MLNNFKIAETNFYKEKIAIVINDFHRDKKKYEKGEVFSLVSELNFIDDEIKIAIQVNGKVRGEMMVNVNDNEEVVKDKAMEYTSVLKYFNGQKPQKVIYVKNRLINIVL